MTAAADFSNGCQQLEGLLAGCERAAGGLSVRRAFGSPDWGPGGWPERVGSRCGDGGWGGGMGVRQGRQGELRHISGQIPWRRFIFYRDRRQLT